jgi:hypothetical protein
MKIVSLAVAAILMTGMASSAMAQEGFGRNNPYATATCDEFAKQNCPGMQGNERRTCLESNITKVNAECRAWISVKPAPFPTPTPGK